MMECVDTTGGTDEGVGSEQMQESGRDGNLWAGWPGVGGGRKDGEKKIVLGTLRK